MAVIKNEKSKAISIILAFIVLFTCVFSYPITESHAITVEKLVTKYHLDIGVQQIWGTQDKSGNVIWDNGIGPGDDMNVTTTVPFPQDIYNVKVYPYSASKFQWGDTNYSSNIGIEEYYNNNYKKYASTIIEVTTPTPTASGNTVTFSHIAKMSSSLQYDVARELRNLQIDDIFRLMAGPEPANPEAAVAHNFPALYSKLNEGRNGVDSKVHAYMYFTPVIIQYDVKEMVEIGDFEPDLDLPATAKQGDTFEVSDASNIDDKITVEEAVLERCFNGGMWEHVITWRGTGTPGENTGERIGQIGNEIGTIEYKITVRVTNGEEKSKIKSIEIVDGRIVEGTALLDLPEYTYEGHKVLADDESTFTVNETPYSALRMYNENLADNSFSIVESNAGKITKLDWPTYAEAVFERRGNYHVRLDIDINIGSKARLKDIKPIEVRKTPYIIDNLGGRQKQNRRQDVFANIATHPKYPITEARITIEDMDTGEKITHSYDGTFSGLNSTHIKSRTMQTVDERTDEYFTMLDLPFLTKPEIAGNEKGGTYKYSIFVKDSKGDTDEKERIFVVEPDLKPIPVIQADPIYLRDKEQNTATVTVEDMGVATDGDQSERFWTGQMGLPIIGTTEETMLPGIEDLSFGSGKKVSFKKEGVGAYNVKLMVKDKWSDETLPEYINEEDYLKGETEKKIIVGNIAPVVFIEPIFPASGELTVFADKNNYEDAILNKMHMKEAFLRENMDVKINLHEFQKPNDLTDFTKLTTLNHKFGYEGGNGAYQQFETALAIDDKRFYIGEGMWPYRSGQGVGPGSNFILKAYDLDNMAEIVAESQLGGSSQGETITKATCWQCILPTTNFTIGQDDTDTYLYIIEGSKTTIIDKNTGSIVVTLPFAFGNTSFVTDEHIYTMKSDGFYAVSRKSGRARQIATTNVTAGQQGIRRLGGNLQFVQRKGDILYRVIFNLNNEGLSKEKIASIPSDGLNYTVGLAGLDMAGKIAVTIGPALKIYDRNNKELVSKSISGSVYTIPNEKGEFEIYGVKRTYDSGEYEYCDMTMFEVFGDKAASAQLRTSSEEKDFIGPLVYSRDTGDRVVMGFGNDWCHLPGYGVTLFNIIHEYDLNKKSFTLTSRSSNGSYIDIADGFGGSSDRYSYINSADNDLSKATMRTKLFSWGQSQSDIAEKNIKKFLKNDEDLDMEGYTVLLDSEKNADDSLIDLIEYIKETGARLITSASQTADSYINKIQEEIAGIQLDTESASLFKGITKELIDSKESGRKVLQITPNTSEASSTNATLTRNFELVPGTKYYYEYDVKGQASPENVISIDYDVVKANPNLSFLNDKYSVEAEFYEDFEDSEINSFFTLSDPLQVKSGQYQAAATYNTYDRKGSSQHTEEDKVSFTVPEGKEAVLSFDYEYKLNQGFEHSCGAYIDGELWDKETYAERSREKGYYSNGPTKTGTYIHSVRLKEGAHILSLQTAWYGSSYDTHFYLNNLSVMLVGKSEKTLQKQCVVKEKGSGWNTIKGSFTTPDKIVNFSALPMSTYVEDFNDGSMSMPITMKSGGIRPGGMFAGSGSLFRSYRAGSHVCGIYPQQGEIIKTYVDSITSVGQGSISNPSYFTFNGVKRYADGDDYFKSFTPGGYSSQMTLFEILFGPNNVDLKFENTYSSCYEIDNVAVQRFPNIDPVKNEEYFLELPAGTIITGGTGDWMSTIKEKPSIVRPSKFYVPDDIFAEGGTITMNFLPENIDDKESSYYLQNLKIYRIENGVKHYISNEHFTEASEKGLGGWRIAGGEVDIIDKLSIKEKDPNVLVYQKGELVNYNVFYSDYENDPSKRQYWRYIHEPFNDGEHSEAAVIVDSLGNIIGGPGKDENLPADGKEATTNPAITNVFDKPIERFYVDGKYTVQHWQEDNTARSDIPKDEKGYPIGNPDYDKLSNVVEITFYIVGEGEAPWVTDIKTVPGTIKENETYYLDIGIDDTEKDVLSLRTEVYKEGKKIYTHFRDNIHASGKSYPRTVTDILTGIVGSYTVVCTVKDKTGAGLGSYKYVVVSDGKITGEVYHTEQWDVNRKKFNLSWFKEEVNREYTMSEYLASGSDKKVNSGSSQKPRKRGTNVFWSGERFMLNAAVAGTPTKVTCQIKGYTYSAVMKNTGKKNKEGEAIYQGSIWDNSMINKWGKKEPEQLTFEFTANYAGGTKKTHEVKVIVDDLNPYWRLHRVF